MNFHGGNIYDCSSKMIDFSSNINPLGVPHSFKLALEQRLHEFTQYPDINYWELRCAIGDYLKTEDIRSIVPGNGAIEIIYRAIAKSGKERVVGLKPTFSEYSRAAAHSGIPYVSVNAYDAEYSTVDIAMLVDAAGENGAVILCNPNNPTGTLVDKSKMLQLAEALLERNSLLIIDEAFMEFTPDYPANSMVDQVSKYSNIFIVKAVTKFYGMPGIRLGYGISSNYKLIEAVKESMEPWNVNTAAVIAGCSVLKDEEYIAQSKQWIESERGFVFRGLEEMAGIKVFRSFANFHLVKLVDDNLDAWEIKKRLMKRNILIRTPDGFDGLDGKYLRLAVKDRRSNEIMLCSLCNSLGK